MNCEQWKVAEVDGSLEWTGHAYDSTYAATKAAEHWRSHGAWSGDPIPEQFWVVAESGGLRRRMKVVVQWEPTFYAYEVEDE